jgi:glyoxylase-like metal-dependent hydrolase (beta-lactamase superfamily II)
MSYLLKRREGWVAFCGDVIVDGAKMHNWFDTEWDYGFGKGLYAQFNAAHLLESFNPVMLLPSHGPEIRDARRQLVELRRAAEKAA